MEFPTLTSDRFELQPVDETHAELMFCGLSDVRAYRFLDEAPPKSLDVLRQTYSNLSIRVRPDIPQHWLNWVITEHDRREGLGYVQATSKTDEKVVLIAYHVFPQFWRRGVATEAVKSMLHFLDSTYPEFVRVALIDPQNTGSIALIENLGFQKRRASESGDLVFENMVSSGNSPPP